MRNYHEKYGSAENKPLVGDTVFHLGENKLVRDVREDENHNREILTIRRGYKEWIPAGVVELVKGAESEKAERIERTMASWNPMLPGSIPDPLDEELRLKGVPEGSDPIQKVSNA